MKKQPKQPAYLENTHNIVVPPDLYWETRYGYFVNIQGPSKGNWRWGGDVYSCREDFQRYSHRIRRFLFSHMMGVGPRVAAFIHQVEAKLGLPERSVFGAASRPTWTWIEPLIWWTEQSMKRSLFTALLRAAPVYEPERDNFWGTILAYDYLRRTESAVRRFLDGYTHYTGRVFGWVNQFERVGRPWYTGRSLVELLVRPEK